MEKLGSSFTLPSNIDNEKLEWEDLTVEQLRELAYSLEEKGVFYSFPLDLDMAMIRAYPSCYDASSARESSREILEKAVLGEGNNINKFNENENKIYSYEELKKYRNLFCTKSKVASHYEAISGVLLLDDIEKRCPDCIKRLILKCSEVLKEAEYE